MTHERQQIREAVVNQVRGTAPNFRTSARERVFKTRLAPIRTAELPAVNVYCDSEIVNAESVQTAPRRLMRTATVTIEAWVRAIDNVDDTLDALALEIETAMDADDSHGGAAFSSILTQTAIEFTLEGDRPMGCVRLDYAVTFETDQRVTPAVDVFDTAHVTTDLAGAQAPADETQDHLTGINQEP